MGDRVTFSVPGRYPAHVGHALFLQDLEPPAPELVLSAVRGLDFTDLDGLRRAVARAHGVLFDGLSVSVAERVAAGLVEQGVQVEVGSDSWLNLPPSLRCRSFRRTQDGIELCDVHGRAHLLSRSQLVLLSAGRLQELGDLAEQPGGASAPGHADPARHDEALRLMRALGTAAEAEATQEPPTGGALVLDLFTTEPVARYSVRADWFHYGGLSGTLAAASSTNFVRLLRELCEWAPLVRMNRGARALLSDHAAVVYATRAGFERESSHHLFHAHAGDLGRYPLPERSAPTGLPAEAEAMLATLALSRGRPVAAAQRSRKWAWVGVQLVLLSLLLFWFLQVVGGFRAPGFE